MIAKWWEIFIILCSFQSLLLSFTKASNIVGFPNLNYISHSRVLWKLGQELTSRGHNYTQLLGSCAKEKSLADVNVLIFNTSVTSERIEEVMLYLGKAGMAVSTFLTILISLQKLSGSRVNGGLR